MELSHSQRFDLIWFGIGLAGGIWTLIYHGRRFWLARRKPEEFLLLEQERLSGKPVSYRKIVVRLTFQLVIDLFWIAFSLAAVLWTLLPQ